MGWLYKQSLLGHYGPRQYLDAQFTYDRPEVSSRVLRSALVSMRVYYAAVEQVRAGGEREVFALICLVRHNPRDREGYIFGYKDMSEGMGPNESDCPEKILDLLTPTDRPYAIVWRARCRTNIDARRALTAKPALRPGQTIIFDAPIRFRDGQSLSCFEIVSNPRSHRTVLFRDPRQGGVYQIPSVRRRDYRLIDPPPT